MIVVRDVSEKFKYFKWVSSMFANNKFTMEPDYCTLEFITWYIISWLWA